MAVDDLKEFHHHNMKDNKKHYTIFSRITHGRVVNMVQRRGAKIHFNEILLPNEYNELILDGQGKSRNASEEPEDVYFRYGIIGLNDMMRDLKYWETLLVSSMMMRPIKKVVD